MKRIGKALALALAVCVLFSACGGNAGKGGGVTENHAASGGEDESGAVSTWTELLDWPEAADAAPDYGELPGRMEGCFYSGTTVPFRYGAFTTSDDGVYFVDAYAAEPEPVLVVDDSVIFDTSICTDGFTVYYINGHGELIEASLSDGGQRQVTNGADFPFFAGVIGAGADRAYVQIPGGYEDTDGPGELDSVCSVSLETGEKLETWDWFGAAGCAGGYTAIYGEGYDAGPRQYYVFDYDGNVVVDEPECMGGSVSGGHVFYSVVEQDEDGAGRILLCQVGPEGAAQVLAQDLEPDATPYGFFAAGFSAFATFSSGQGEIVRETYDLRTKEPTHIEDSLSFYDGWSLDGEEYLAGLGSVYRWRDGEAVCVFELPEDLRYSGLLLCGNYILLDAEGGALYALPLDSENTVHPISVTATMDTLEEYDGRNGASVTASFPVLMTENYYTREALSEELKADNEAARLTAQANAAECANQASQLIENGFAAPTDSFSVSTRDYIQRADTLAFTFVQHQTMDNRVNREAMDLKIGFNYDSADGHPLRLDEVITDEDGLMEILLDHLEESGFADRDALSEFLDQFFQNRTLTSTDQFSWVLGYEGISFYFNGNINFPYAQSSYKCTIPFTDAQEIFNPKYFNVPDSYAYDILLDDYFMEEYRLQTDSGAVRAWPTVLQTGGYGVQLSVVIDGEENDAQLFGYPVYGTLVHVNKFAAPEDGLPRTGGKNYLVVQTCGVGDMAVEVLDLNGGLHEAWDFGQSVLPQHLPQFENWDYASMGLMPVHVWLSNPDCFTVLYYDAATENYTVKGVYAFNDGAPRLLDIFGTSLAVG